ncbi:DUF5658 family protein [Haloterrigena alkaliphila]|uniref:DUF5658 domain-containing protein n=1 Tax=Haloterrigena alkaliphila TaxID=2816475 RepID=A0A8A2VC28_9EURY|nr:DUF5658 family protein [Haloterrigena alkaliphila]QSW98267.1 DUF5658 family protein [Haloterrigena alkaliphila]
MSSDGAYPQFELPFDLSPTTLERALWVVVALSLVADVITTFVGLHLGLAESNPVARSAIEGHGLAGMLVLKAAAVGIALVCRPILPTAYRPIIPAGLVVPWTIAVCINVYTISNVL